jgi:hypothetical protein
LRYKQYASVKASGGIPGTMANFPRKVAFAENDRYLIGKETCGAYLNVAPGFQQDLYIQDNSYISGLKIRKDKGSIRIPIVFQVRMTDYYGMGSTGIGLVGGYDPAAPLAIAANVTYSKKIGLDIALKGKLFSLDLRFTMQYQKMGAKQA